MNRIKSRIWVEALLRRCQSQGKFGAVLKTGADEAGAVFVAINRLNGTLDLLAPPPGPSTDDAGERWFQKTFPAPVSPMELNTFIERQKRFDQDFWVVEIETREGFADLSLAPTD